MKPFRSGRSLRLKAALVTLSLTAMTTQVGGATAPPRAGAAPAVQPSAAAVLPMPGERELLARLTQVLSRPPVSGDWALLIAGLTGAWAIGRRRSAFGHGALDPRRLRQ